MNDIIRYIVSSESIGDSVFQPWTFGLLDTPNALDKNVSLGTLFAPQYKSNLLDLLPVIM